VSRYQKCKTSLDFTKASASEATATWRFTNFLLYFIVRDSDWQWHQLGHMQVCTSLQTDNHTSTPPLSFFTGWMPFLPPYQQHQSTEGN